MQQVIARPPGRGSFPFFVHKSPDIFISTRIRKTGLWEPFESRVLLALLQSGDQVIDVGANIGWYTVNAARCFPSFDDRGTLNVGAPADVAIMELRDGTFEFLDNYKGTRTGHQRLFPAETVLAGKRVPRA